jgi:riboflavin kinase/FMN adenylyltransferase
LLGGFDGLHIGHRQLLARAKSLALPVGVMTIVGGKGLPIFTTEEREEIFSSLGADFAFELPFDEIKGLSPETFVGLLKENFNVQAFVCGDDFRFGKNALGTPETLKAYGQVRVEVEKLISVDGEKVSSKTVKTLLELGDIEKANELLGERFFLIGEVEKDRQVGRTLGFPTANIRYPNGKFSIKKGVYAGEAEIGGVLYKGIINYGARPTFQNGDVWTETYFDGFDGDLYGKRLKIRFAKFLREIKKFDGVEALKAQLTRDIRSIREND